MIISNLGGTRNGRRSVILDDSVGHATLRPRLFAAVPRDNVEAQVPGLDERVTDRKSDVIHGLVRRFSHLRQFLSILLCASEFIPDVADDDVPSLVVQIIWVCGADPECRHTRQRINRRSYTLF